MPEELSEELSYDQLLRWGRAQLRGCDSPALDARLLMMEAACLDHPALIMMGTHNSSQEHISMFRTLVKRRRNGEPVSQIIGRKEFWGLTFEVSKDVLTPRPETELLIGLALDLFDGREPRCILDLGTGSGCLIITLLTQFKTALGTGIDICPKALSIAQRNRARHGLSERMALRHGDFADPLFYGGDIDLVVSNPPYISQPERTTLPRDVVDFEPEKALFGGRDGLDAYRSLFALWAGHLPPHCVMICEIGATQGEAVNHLAKRFFPARLISTHEDLAGRNRAIAIR